VYVVSKIFLNSSDAVLTTHTYTHTHTHTPHTRTHAHAHTHTHTHTHKHTVAPVINLTHSRTSNGFRLTCSVIAYPRVESVRWEAVDSGNAIPGSNDIVCQTESTTFDFCLTSTLDIESSSCDQAGYRCTVTNMPRISSQSVSVCPTGKFVCVCVVCACVCSW